MPQANFTRSNHPDFQFSIFEFAVSCLTMDPIRPKDGWYGFAPQE